MFFPNRFIICCLGFHAIAMAFAEQKQAVWTAKTFTFHTGQTLQNMKIGYITLGNPANPAVLILHGTTQDANSMLSPTFGGQLFNNNQILDSSKYYIIIPDGIGVGQSSKPSDGLRAEFPNYDYDDMVHANYRLLTEGLGIKHLRLVLGYSMGGMQTWLWGIYYNNFMDYLIPQASTPINMSGRNWMLRYIFCETIRNDPTWLNGNYVDPPHSYKLADAFLNFATIGGSQHLQAIAPNSTAAELAVNQHLAQPLIDANDYLFQYEASRDYNPVGLDKIKAKVLAINSSDDERNPPELGLMGPLLQQIKYASLYIIPGSNYTDGHGTNMYAHWWIDAAGKFLYGNNYKKPTSKPVSKPTTKPTRMRSQKPNHSK